MMPALRRTWLGLILLGMGNAPGPATAQSTRTLFANDFSGRSSVRSP